jgi:hypothetical protein
MNAHVKIIALQVDPDALKQYTAAHGVLIPLHIYDAQSARSGTIRKDGKRPIHNDWTKRPYSSAKVLTWCMEHNHNVGVRLPADIVVIDIDPRNGGNEGWDTLTMEYGVDEAIFPCTITGSGGRHYWARKPVDLPIRDTLPGFDGVEFKSKGRQVVAAGSIHPETEEHYRWDDDAPAPYDIPEIPEALLHAITRPQRTAVTSGGQLDQEEAEKVLSRLDPQDFRSHDKWLHLMMSIHHATLGDARQEWVDWCISDPQYAHDAEQIGRRWDSLHTEKSDGPMVGIGTLRHYLSEAKALDVLPPDSEQAAADFEGEDDPDFDMSEDDSWMDGPVEPPPMVWDLNNANEMLTDVEGRMLRGGAPLYQTGGRIVHPVRALRASSDDDSIRRPAGALTIQDVKAPRLTLYMIKHGRFVRYQKAAHGGEPKLVKQPANRNIADLYLSASDTWKLPWLAGIVETPTLRCDGTLLNAPGYDPESGLLLDMGDAEYPAIADQPSREVARAALGYIAEPFKGFPFVPDGRNGTSASRSVMLSAVLTALVRRTLPTAPMHGVSAPTPGTGKTLAIQVVSMIAMGRAITAMSQGANGEEDEKRLFSVLMQGDQMVAIDNVTRPIGGDALCTILTEPTWQNRILGESRNVSVQTNALLTATGNNLTFAGDMTRRALLCRMDAGLENPEGRSFDMDLRTWVPEHRVRLVAAGLTVLRAFVCAGRPGLDRLKPFGSFEAWSNLVRGALVWLGEPDPCITRKHIAADDPVKAQLAAFFTSAHNAMGDRWFNAGDLLKESFEAVDDLSDIIYAVVPKANRLSLGHFLKANENKIVGGLTLRSRFDSHQKSWAYRIIAA